MASDGEVAIAVGAPFSSVASSSTSKKLEQFERRNTTTVGGEVTPRPKKMHRRSKSERKGVTKSERKGVTRSAKRRSQRIMSATRRAKHSSQKFSLSDSDSDSDDVIIIHMSDLTTSASVSHQSTAPRKEMVEARKKLSLLLATDNPVLLSSNELSEILRLTSLLKTDSTLNPNEHDILKLIDEIPLACKELQETEKTTEEADRFNEDLETNIAWATTLENEYDHSKGYVSLLQTELDSSSQEIKKLQEQIDVLTKAAEMKKKEVDKLISKQQMADECLPKVLKDIETGKDQKSEWELKKQRAEEKKAKILSKFAPLKGLSL